VSDYAPDAFNTFFGVSRGLEFDEIIAIRDYLKAAWRAQYGQAPSTLSADLEILEDLFHSHMLAKRLRGAAEELSVIHGRRPALPEAVFIAIDDQRGFVTPEGRILLDHLEGGDQFTERVLTRDSLLLAYARAADFYGTSQRQWMRKQLVGKDVRPGTLGFAMFLLVNNSVGVSHAFLLPSSPEEEEALARRVLPIVSVFSTSVGGSPVSPRESERLRSNWIITETKRQLGQYVSRTEGRTVKFWIEEARETDLIDEIGRQLAKRKDLNSVDIGNAVEASLTAYNLSRPMLASWGLSYERSAHTRRVFTELSRAYTNALKYKA
jgi:hypothetical protein